MTDCNRPFYGVLMPPRGVGAAAPLANCDSAPNCRPFAKQRFAVPQSGISPSERLNRVHGVSNPIGIDSVTSYVCRNAQVAPVDVAPVRSPASLCGRTTRPVAALCGGREGNTPPRGTEVGNVPETCATGKHGRGANSPVFGRSRRSPSGRLPNPRKGEDI